MLYVHATILSTMTTNLHINSQKGEAWEMVTKSIRALAPPHLKQHPAVVTLNYKKLKQKIEGKMKAVEEKYGSSLEDAPEMSALDESIMLLIEVKKKEEADTERKRRKKEQEKEHLNGQSEVFILFWLINIHFDHQLCTELWFVFIYHRN